MKKDLLSAIIVLLFLVFNSHAQSTLNQMNIWYFNFYAGIDFNSGSPVSLNNGSLYTDEGCTSICDSNGVLLFYSNGVTVYNANHAAMVNGTGLHGGTSTSQACLAVRQPGSNVVWYLFTVDQAGGTWGAQYSIIDMSLQGGLGEVIVKNNPLISPVEEKVTGCLQSNGIDYWILFHGSNNKKFHAFPLTDLGVGTEVTSTAGSQANTGTGYMKFSPDGSQLAVARYNNHTFQVHNFDNDTGIVSYGFNVPLGNQFYSYGVEWSRDGRHLFMGNVDYMPGQVYEMDMTLGDSTAIIASKVLVVNAANDILGALQMAPDGKIYLVRYSEYYLGVINEPDSLGAACDYVSNGFSTSPNDNYLGLPNYVTSWYYQPNDTIPQINFSAGSAVICEKFCTQFFDSSLNNPTGWQWIFPGGSPDSSSLQNPTVCYATPGVYDVTLITTSATGMDTLTLPGYITVNPTPPFPVITQAGYTLTSSPADTYQWQLNSSDIPGATNQSYDVLQSGLYTVIVSDTNGCSNSASREVQITGIEVITDQDITVYPNPSDGNFIIHFSGISALESFTMSVLNTLGQEVYVSEEKIPDASFTTEIDLRGMSKGVYVIQLKTENFIMVKKLLILQ